MLVSPAEPRRFHALGTVSSSPERYGLDFMWVDPSTNLRYGVQRKEINDLIASDSDGRLKKELAQMSAVEHPLLVVEGKLGWTTEGKLMGDFKGGWGREEVTLERFQGILWACQSSGCWVAYTQTMQGTAEMIRVFEAWTKKRKHSSLKSREPIKRNGWGMVGDREYALHFLEGVPGVGRDVATVIYDAMGVPMQMRDGWREEMKRIKGIGPKRIEAFERLFEGVKP